MTKSTTTGNQPTIIHNLYQASTFVLRDFRPYTRPPLHDLLLHLDHNPLKKPVKSISLVGRIEGIVVRKWEGKHHTDSSHALPAKIQQHCFDCFQRFLFFLLLVKSGVKRSEDKPSERNASRSNSRVTQCCRKAIGGAIPGGSFRPNGRIERGTYA